MRMLLLMHAPSVLAKATEPGTSAQLKAFTNFMVHFESLRLAPTML